MTVPVAGPHIIFEIVRLFLCQKCGNKWGGRREDIPRVCPKCKSYHWHLAKIEGVGRPKKSVIE